MEPEWISEPLNWLPLGHKSRSAYASCMIYWNVWHTAHYGAPLPLSRRPVVSPLAGEKLEAFVQDHLPVVMGGQVTPLMDYHIQSALKSAGFNRRISCSSEATTKWRMGVIQSVHRALNLPFDAALKASLVLGLHSEWQRAYALEAMDRNCPTGRDIVLRLIHGCPDNREGVRMRAIITLLQYLTPKQLSNLQFGDLTPGHIDDKGYSGKVVEIYIRDPVNKFQALFQKARLVGIDARNINLWGCVRLYDEYGEGVEYAPKKLDFIVRDVLEGTKSVTPNWINAKLQNVILKAGLEGVLQNQRRRYWASAIRLRCARESEQQRSLMNIAHRADLKSAISVYNILRSFNLEQL